MFTRKIKTVASVMESFVNTIKDLQEIIEANALKSNSLNEERLNLEMQIETIDAEIELAHGVENRLNDLVFGTPKSSSKSNE